MTDLENAIYAAAFVDGLAHLTRSGEEPVNAAALAVEDARCAVELFREVTDPCQEESQDHPTPPIAHKMSDLVDRWIYRDQEGDLWHCLGENIALITLDLEWRDLRGVKYRPNSGFDYFPLQAVCHVGNPADLRAACRGLL